MAALSLTPRGFQSKLHRGGRFTPDELAILMRELPDERLARWLLAGSGLLLVRRPAASNDEGRGTLLAALLVGAGECLAMLCDLASVLEGSSSGPHDVGLGHYIDRAQSVILQAKACFATSTPSDEQVSYRALPNGFGALVNEIVVKEGHIPPRQLAASLAISYHALHARLLGLAVFAPGEIRRLLQLHPDPRIADYLLDRTPYIAIARPAASGDMDADYGPLQMGLISLREVLGLMGLLIGASDPPTNKQVTEAQQQIGAALRQLAALHWRLTHIGHPSSSARRVQEEVTG